MCHTHFDRVAMVQATSKYDLRLPSCKWLDSARVARRTWEQFASKGYGLDSVCSFLGYEFAHHDALEDAKAAAHILLVAIERSGTDVQGWLHRVEEPCGEIARLGIRRGLSRRSHGVYGALEIPRWQAAAMAAKIGCSVGEGVTKKTTMLVVGDQDTKKLAGQEKSSKHRKAEKLMREGQMIRILEKATLRNWQVTLHD